MFCANEIGLIKNERKTTGTEKKGLQEIIEQYKKPGEKLIGYATRPQSLAKDQIIISPSASMDINLIFDARNKEEQIGVLLGNIYRNASYTEEAFIVDIKKVVEIKPAHTSPNQLLISDTIYEQADKIEKDIALEGNVQMEVVGFIHSHSGDLGIAMSFGDFEWHKSLYKMDWKKALTIIINQQKKMVAAYAGPSANHVELILLQMHEKGLRG